MEILKGKGVSGGIAIGRLHMHHTGETAYSADEQEDAAGGEKRFREICDILANELAELRKSAMEKAGEAEAEIFDIHRMMLEDEGFTEPTEARIRSGMSVKEAIKQTGEELASLFSSMNDPYMQAREADIRSIVQRLIQILQGEASFTMLPETPVILGAEDLSPAQTIVLDTERVLGFVTEKGSTTSHTAILARTLNIPAVAAVGEIPENADGREAVLDGEKGIVYIEPTNEIREMYALHMENKIREQNALETLRGKVCMTPSGVPIRILANAGSLADVKAAAAGDAEGIGLFRSEFLFMQYDRCPTEDEQLAVYKKVLESMPGREVTIRTLDAGADKQIAWLTHGVKENNPALGLRAVRLCLQNPRLLYTQLRALYRASAYGDIRAMIPMISIPEELDQVRQIAENVCSGLQADGIGHNPDMPIGIMIETPAAALAAGVLASKADFFSLGTNDLIQYTMAADRENPAVAYLTEHLPEAVKKLIAMTAGAAANAEIPVSVCGELASDPTAVPFLLEAGITKLSVSPSKVLKVRQIVQRTLERQDEK